MGNGAGRKVDWVWESGFISRWQRTPKSIHFSWPLSPDLGTNRLALAIYLANSSGGGCLTLREAMVHPFLKKPSLDPTSLSNFRGPLNPGHDQSSAPMGRSWLLPQLLIIVYFCGHR